MKVNNSPWVYQVDGTRKNVTLTHDEESDVVIVGGGIAGISTAFFALKYTNKKVILCDRYKIGHGATGHNAGQIVSYFERPFRDLVREFGLEKTARSQQGVESAWTLLDEMYTDAGLDIPLSRFEGHAGIQTKEQLFSFLEDLRLRKEAGLPREKLAIALELVDTIEEELKPYVGLYVLESHQAILDRLETHNQAYFASLSYQKGVTNSVLFVTRLALYLQEQYKERFFLYENTLIRKVILHDAHVLLDAGQAIVTAQQIILCTNGFEHFTILTQDGLELNNTFHAHVYGRIGYMSAYLDKLRKPPTAISYLNQDLPVADASYHYLTRRPFEYESDDQHNLICIGGPDKVLDDVARYSHTAEYPEEAIEEIDNFLKENIDKGEKLSHEYVFTWHGLMGYTKNFVRMIGPHKKYRRLFFNLGCNGIGILPSIYGAKRISQFLNNEKVEETIFDVTL